MLYKQTGEERYKKIVMKHADTVLDIIFKPDGSAWSADFDYFNTPYKKEAAE